MTSTNRIPDFTWAQIAVHSLQCTQDTHGPGQTGGARVGRSSGHAPLEGNPCHEPILHAMISYPNFRSCLSTRTPLASALAIGLAGLVGLGAASGCGTTQYSARTTAPPLIPAHIQPVVLDGDTSEWPPGLVVMSDPWWLYLRWKVAGSAQTLQASDESLAILLDLDTNPATGLRPDTPAVASQLGIDLEIEFSPPADDSSGLGKGVRLTEHTASGDRVVSHADLGFSFAPTYAAEWYEGRLSRAQLATIASASNLADNTGLISGIFVLYDATGAVIGSSEPFELTPTKASLQQPRADVQIPPKPGKGLRVVSWNMLQGKPMEDPGPFARVLRVLDPDVILIQEWPSDVRDITAWLNASIPLAQGTWHVRTTAGWGVAVASRFPLEPFAHDELYVNDQATRPIRFAGALIDTPVGMLAASSVHLKCCGSSGSPEDQTRISEAGAINRSLHEALKIEPVSLRIITGDLNLVGSRPPLDVLRNGLDADDSDLAIADARDLGDAAYITWREDSSSFSPGRLDYALISDATATITHAFVLDARILSDRALRAAGLDPTDTDASDHLPVVIDITPK